MGLHEDDHFEETVPTRISAPHEVQFPPRPRPLSFPDVELLVVVHQDDHPLFEYLQRRFADVRGVQVILERREGERRHEAIVRGNERRQLQRRVRQGQVFSLGYRLVRFR
jgi:hypothetical protein